MAEYNQLYRLLMPSRKLATLLNRLTVNISYLTSSKEETLCHAQHVFKFCYEILPQKPTSRPIWLFVSIIALYLFDTIYPISIQHTIISFNI